MKPKAKPTVKKGRQIALHRIQRHFPQVKTVEDADEALLINVTQADSDQSVKEDPEHCALACAVKREKIADGAIIGVSYSWLIKGTKALRFKTSEAVGREITSFDRAHDFAAGENYRLSPVPPASRLGMGRVHTDTGTGDGKQDKRIVHRTARIRALWKR